MRQKRVRLLNDTFRRLRGRRPYGTSWCKIESRRTTWKPWRWGRCGNIDGWGERDIRHTTHRYRRSGIAFWNWGLTDGWGHIQSERRLLKKIYNATRRAA